MKKIALASPQPTPFDLDLDNLLHPAQAFEHPRQVVEDPDLTLNEKRAILASWAYDACAIEAAPAPGPARARPVRFDDVLAALRVLNQQAGNHCSAPPRYRRILENRIPWGVRPPVQGPPKNALILGRRAPTLDAKEDSDEPSQHS